MRIIFIRSNPVAPYPRLEKTVNSLVMNGHEAHILAWDRSAKYSRKDSTHKLRDCQVPITRFGIPGKFGGGFKVNLFPLIKFQFNIFFWLFKNRKLYDAIHAYDFDTGYIALKCAKLLNKKLIYDIPDYYVDSHGLKGTLVGKLIQKMENNIINKANAVIICTEQRKEQIAGTSPKNLAVIHNSPVSINLEKYKQSTDHNSNEKIKIVYVGILAASRFLKEIAEVVIRRDDCEFHVGGFGYLDEYFIELSEKYSNIYYYGRITYEETLKLESKCDVITAVYDPDVPNHYYAAPNKFYEALMLGKPIIMAKNTGMSDVVLKNEIGEVIEYDAESFNDAINKLKRKKKQWNKISERAKKLYETEYSWTIMASRLLELYNNI